MNFTGRNSLLPRQQQIEMSNSKAAIKHKLRAKIILIYLIIFGFKFSKCHNNNNEEDSDDKSATFQFPEYDYKENNKNELAYREAESNCEQSDSCQTADGLEQIKCIRKCISPSCHREIYDFDELEEGEIDVRLNSFKGCFIQQITNPSPI